MSSNQPADSGMERIFSNGHFRRGSKIINLDTLLKENSNNNQPPIRPSFNISSRIPFMKLPIDPFKSIPFLTTPRSTTEALPKIIVPNLPIQSLNPMVTQSSISLTTRQTPKINLFERQQTSTTTVSTVHENSKIDSSKVDSHYEIHDDLHEDRMKDDKEEDFKSSSTNSGFKKSDETVNVFNSNQTDIIQNGDYNKVYNDISHNHINEQSAARTPAPFVKSSTDERQQSNTEPTLITQQPTLIKRSMLNNNQSTVLSIFLTISTTLSIGISCLTLIIFIFSR